MYKSGHTGMTLIFYSPVALLLILLGEFHLAILAGLIMIASSSIPDWDMWLPFVKHRGLTHTILFAFIYGIIWGGIIVGGVYILSITPLSNGFVELELNTISYILYSIFGITVGFLAIISHLAADIITPMGLKPFRPFSNQRYGIRIARAKDPAANALLLTSGWILAALAWVGGVYATTGFDFNFNFNIAVSTSSGIVGTVIQGFLILLVLIFGLLLLVQESS